MSKLQSSKIGVLGGSFDPAHRGHLLITNFAIKKIKLKKVYWVITKKNPFKKKTFFSLKYRIKLAEKIIRKNKNIEVLYLDALLKSTRSIDIIKYMLKEYKIKNLYLIIGSDILLDFHKWKSWKKIVKLAKLVVFSRKGYDRKRKETIVVKYLKKNRIIFAKNKPIKASSTALRKKLNN